MTDHALKPWTAPFRDSEGGAATVRVMAANPLAAVGAARASHVAEDALDGREIGFDMAADDLGVAFEDNYGRTAATLYEGHIIDLFHHGMDPGTAAAPAHRRRRPRRVRGADDGR